MQRRRSRTLVMVVCGHLYDGHVAPVSSLRLLDQLSVLCDVIKALHRRVVTKPKRDKREAFGRRDPRQPKVGDRR